MKMNSKKDMKVWLLSTVFSVFAVFLCSADTAEVLPVLPERKAALLDFEFSGVNGKQMVSDRTGRFKLISDTAPFIGENGALRVANSAQLRIPCPNHAFGEQLTIEMWFLVTKTWYGYTLPLLERGLQYINDTTVQPYERKTGQFDFSLYICNDLPGFVTGNTGTDKVGTEGLVAYGHSYSGNSRSYYNYFNRKPNPSVIHNDQKKIFRKNYWQHIAAVYDHGATTIYLNGIKIASNPIRRKEPFLTCGRDLYLGAFRYDNVLNKATAEMLVKNLSITGRVLSEKEISTLFQQEKGFFDIDRERPNLKNTKHYYTKDQLAADHGLVKELRIVKQYKKNLPRDPYVGRKTMTAAIDGSGVLQINGKKELAVQAKMYYPDLDLRRRSVIVSDFAAAGVDIINFCPRNYWLDEGKYDWKKIDDMLAMHVKTCPTVKLEVHLGTATPAWFRKKYPEEDEMQARMPFTSPLNLKKWVGSASLLGSERYIQAANRMIRDVVKHCEESPYANHIWGYHLNGGDAGEWYWPGQFTFGGLTGYSQPTRELFRKYLRKKYNNDVSALRKAWKNDKIDFETVEIPHPHRRWQKSENYIFRDPEQVQDIADIRHFMQERTVYCVTEAARAIKETAGKHKLVTVYYGYPILYANRKDLAFSGLQTTSEIFRSPYIDRVATPHDYSQRRCGDPGVVINGFNGSARLFNKGIWIEEDSSTHLSEQNKNTRTSTLRETLEVKRRAFGYTIAHNIGFWYCWQVALPAFHQDEVMEDCAKMTAIARKAYAKPRKSVAEVAVVFDEKDSLTYISPAWGNTYVRQCCWDVYRELYQTGAPFDMYLLGDLDHPDMPDYKVYVFMNTWSVTPDMRKKIHDKISRNNALAVWQYAPGFLDGTRFSLKNMESLTGFAFDMEKRNTVAGGNADIQSAHPIMKGISAQPAKFGPVFSCKEGNGAEILIRSEGRNIAAYRPMPRWRSFWTLLPLNQKLLRNLYDFAGVHIYSRGGETLVCNESYLMVHPPKPGKITIALPEAKTVLESISGRQFGKCKTFSDEVKYRGTTRIYELK